MMVAMSMAAMALLNVVSAESFPPNFNMELLKAPPSPINMNDVNNVVITPHQRQLDEGWIITKVNFTADLSINSVEELEWYFEISKGRAYSANLFNGDCETPISGTVIYTPATQLVITPTSAFDDYLRLGYDIDMSTFGGSNIWNATTGDVEICLKLELLAQDQTSVTFYEDRVTVPRQLQLEDNPNAWDIKYVNFTADLSIDSADELEMYLVIGKGRTYAAAIFGQDCKTPISDTVLYNATAPVITSINATHDYLRLGYDIDKGTIGGSNIWDSSTGQLEICQVVSLLFTPEGGGQWTVAQVKSEFTVNVTLDYDFTINTELTDNGPKFVMIIPGNLTYDDCPPEIPSSLIEKGDAMVEFAETVTEVSRGVITSDMKWRVANATAAVMEPDTGDDVKQIPGPRPGVVYNLTLIESCYNKTYCEALLATSTLYNTMTKHLEENLPGEPGIGSENCPVVNLDFDNPIKYIWYPPSSEVEGINAEDYVEACKCDGVESFTCNSNEALVANEKLFVCIKSSETSVLVIDFLDSMTVTQGEVKPWAVIENDGVKRPQLTSREYIDSKGGVVVTTLLPLNMFTYGQSIYISGMVAMRLAGSERRNLQVATSDVAESAPFQLQIDLEGPGEEDKVSASSAFAVGSKGCSMLGVIFVFTYTLFW